MPPWATRPGTVWGGKEGEGEVWRGGEVREGKQRCLVVLPASSTATCCWMLSAHGSLIDPPILHPCNIERRFEDVAALIAFLVDTFTDAVADIQAAPEDEVPLQLPLGAGAFSSEAAQHMASC